jgi:hypothetical protein
MKSSHWILMISVLALFSAHQTHRSDADKPDYARNPAMIRPVYDLQADLKTGQAKAGSHKTQRAKEKLRKTNGSI